MPMDAAMTQETQEQQIRRPMIAPTPELPVVEVHGADRAQLADAAGTLPDQRAGLWGDGI